VIIRPSAFGSIGAGNVRVIASIGGRSVSPAAGTVARGGERSVESEVVRPSVVSENWASGGHGSAGMNWSVLASSQRQAPGWLGSRVANASG
jgi:hypothetical protein